MTASQNVPARGAKQFPTLEADYTPRNLTSEHKLIIGECRIQTETNTYRLDFKPAYLSCPFPIKLLPFRDWWNRDVIWRASAAHPGGDPTIIPLTVDKQLPYEKRQKLCRREFVELTRNKFGAHLDHEIPEVLDQLQRSRSFGIGFVINIGNRVLNSYDGTLETRIGPAAAVMRQIAQETLIAYGLTELWVPERPKEAPPQK